MTTGYWAMSGAFNAVTGELGRHLLAWATAGAILTALAAATDVRRRIRG